MKSNIETLADQVKAMVSKEIAANALTIDDYSTVATAVGNAVLDGFKDIAKGIVLRENDYPTYGWVIEKYYGDDGSGERTWYPSQIPATLAFDELCSEYAATPEDGNFAVLRRFPSYTYKAYLYSVHEEEDAL